MASREKMLTPLELALIAIGRKKSPDWRIRIRRRRIPLAICASGADGLTSMGYAVI
jgi:hypothetical protein